jgi:hypothetical protein
MSVLGRLRFIARLPSGGDTDWWPFWSHPENIINVKAAPYFAVGDGVTDDRAAIQAAFDAAFGTNASPHGTAGVFLNKPVFFPAGHYAVGGRLTITDVWGGSIFGCSAETTKIRYIGGNDDIDGSTEVLRTKNMNYSNISGLAFDIDGSTITNSASIRLHKKDSGGTGVGTANVIYDCIFENGFGGVIAGWSTGGTGSEHLWINCRWRNCSSYAHHPVSANALAHIIIGGSVENCGKGFWGSLGSFPSIVGVGFIANTDYDILSGANSTTAVGCNSTSPKFWNGQAGKKVIACYHHAASADIFLGGSGTINADGCYSTNGTLSGATLARTMLRGNRFDNAGYLTGMSNPGPIAENI